MLPTALIQGPEVDNWMSLTEVAKAIGHPSPSSAYPFITHNRIFSELMCGRRVYYRPDVEAAAAKYLAAKARHEAPTS